MNHYFLIGFLFLHLSKVYPLIRNRSFLVFNENCWNISFFDCPLELYRHRKSNLSNVVLLYLFEKKIKNRVHQCFRYKISNVKIEKYFFHSKTITTLVQYLFLPVIIDTAELCFFFFQFIRMSNWIFNTTLVALGISISNNTTATSVIKLYSSFRFLFRKQMTV